MLRPLALKENLKLLISIETFVKFISFLFYILMPGYG